MAAAVFRALAAALALSACTSVVADARTFEGTEWRVAAINGEPMASGLHLSFSQGRMGGYLGCNRFGGGYRIAGNMVIPVPPFEMTQMACVSAVDDDPSPNTPDPEGAGMAVLNQPMRMNWSAGDRLTLSNAAGSIALERRD